MNDVVMISTADWNNPLWTNKQHVAVELASLGKNVLYIESTGLRAPSISSSDLKRIIGRIFSFNAKPKKVRENIYVLSPIVLPFQKYSRVRALNKFLLDIQIGYAVKYLKMRPILWTYNPLTSEIINTSPYDLIIYHCVDDFSSQPGMPVEVIRSAENKLFEMASYVFCTNMTLQARAKALNDNSFYFPNVADFSHFNSAVENNYETPIEMENIDGPVVGFFGAISGYKINFELLRAAANMLTDVNFVLIGKVAEGDPSTDISLISNVKNIILVDTKPYAVLPRYLAHFDVAIIPSIISDYTNSMFPMKFFEYMAAGLPVVTTNIVSMKEYEEYIYISEDANSFASNILSAIKEPRYKRKSRIELARNNTYRKRTEAMLAIIEDGKKYE